MDKITLVATIIGILVGIITLIKEWPVITKILAKIHLKKVKVVSIKRRKFIAILSISGLATLTFIKWPNIKKISSSVISIKRPNPDDFFVKNRKTGVIHHINACSDHLPIDLVYVNPDDDINLNTIHSSKLPHLAGLNSSNLNDFDHEALILKAISISPTSTHLYKYLISEWGRKKEYSLIHQLLITNITFIKSKLSKATSNQRLTKKYNKAISELELKLDRANYHANMNKISIT